MRGLGNEAYLVPNERFDQDLKRFKLKMLRAVKVLSRQFFETYFSDQG